jgi:hypothetical protein
MRERKRRMGMRKKEVVFGEEKHQWFRRGTDHPEGPWGRNAVRLRSHRQDCAQTSWNVMEEHERGKRYFFVLSLNGQKKDQKMLQRKVQIFHLKMMMCLDRSACMQQVYFNRK